MSSDPRFLPPTPFTRLVRLQAASVIGDAALAGSLVGSLFFSGTTSGARDKVLLALVLTLLPFAIVTPLLGPALDRVRGGRRLITVLCCVGRCVLCLVMSRYVTKPSPEGLLIYPLAFGALVFGKGYTISRSALVPGLVGDSSELVKANSRLALISNVFTPVGALPALALQKVFDADVSLVFAAIVFAVATGLALKLPKTEVRLDRKSQRLEREELHQPSILLAGSAMGILRGGVGFVVFFAAFAFRDDKLVLGLIAVFAVVGAFVGNLSAPAIRSFAREEVMLSSALLGSAVMAVVGALLGGSFGFGLAALSIAIGSAIGKLGFDSLLQRDGPDAVRGRAFAMFEARFQIIWVFGAVMGLLPVSTELGLICLAIVLLFGGVSYAAALRAARGRVSRSKLRPDAVDRAFGRAKEGVRDRMRQRSTGRKPGGREPGAGGQSPPPAARPTEPRRPSQPPLPPPRRELPESGARRPGAEPPDAVPGGS
jgi:MFS family permease